jgi:DNA-binding MurR/RpiR family transcriptional regulator
MQRALRAEVAAQFRAPLDKHIPWRTDAADTHIVNRFAEAVAANVHHTLQRLDTATFDAVVALLADTGRPTYVAGGRITRSIADYLFNHLQIIRPGVTHFSHSPNVWPQHLIDMDARCVLVLFDIRRYEGDLLKLARLARAREAQIVLFTDQWGSPVAEQAQHRIHGLVEVPSNWDSTVALLVIVEAVIAAVQDRLGESSRRRIQDLEAMFTQTRLFRDFT